VLFRRMRRNVSVRRKSVVKKRERERRSGREHGKETAVVQQQYTTLVDQTRRDHMMTMTADYVMWTLNGAVTQTARQDQTIASQLAATDHDETTTGTDITRPSPPTTTEVVTTETTNAER